MWPLAPGRRASVSRMSSPEPAVRPALRVSGRLDARKQGRAAHVLRLCLPSLFLPPHGQWAAAVTPGRSPYSLSPQSCWYRAPLTSPCQTRSGVAGAQGGWGGQHRPRPRSRRPRAGLPPVLLSSFRVSRLQEAPGRHPGGRPGRRPTAPGPGRLRVSAGRGRGGGAGEQRPSWGECGCRGAGVRGAGVRRLVFLLSAAGLPAAPCVCKSHLGLLGDGRKARPLGAPFARPLFVSRFSQASRVRVRVCWRTCPRRCACT